MPSARYRSLKSNVAKLEKRFLPKRLTGPFSARQHDLARGYRLLAHAEIEAYLEDRATDVALSAVRRFQADRKPHAVLMSLIAFQIVQSEMSSKGRKDCYTSGTDHLESTVQKAINSYQYLVAHNHGVREENVLGLLLPVGFLVSEIDPTWLGDMNSFGRIRGETAHTSYAPTRLVDPATEKTTVEQLVVGLLPIDGVFSRLLQR